MATPATFNNVLLMVNGSTEQVPINGYLTGVTWTSGEQSGHVVTLTPDGNPIDTNLICSSPRGTISFAPMMIESFYQFLNDKKTKFTLQLVQYVTGFPDGVNKSLLIENVRLNEISGSSRPSSTSNESSFSFVATSISYI